MATDRLSMELVRVGRVTRRTAAAAAQAQQAAVKRVRSLSPSFTGPRVSGQASFTAYALHHPDDGSLFMGVSAGQRAAKQARLSSHRTHASVSNYTKESKGENPSLEYRLFVKDSAGKTVSPWHDVPLSAGNGLFNMVVEIPRETKAKMEVATDEKSTPIKQDTKKGKLRDYPYNINWNYGMLPQTWEDPGIKSESCGGVAGDNDPVDVVEIGGTAHSTGDVVAVKPLGVYAMIDDGELDWKVIAIAAADPRAAQLNDVGDVERLMPGELDRIRVWFRDYKIPDGKPANAFGLENRCMPAAYARGIIAETHEAYEALMSGKTANDGLSLV